MRIDKFLSNLKYGSRSEIHKLIKQKRITINHTLCLKKDQVIDPLRDQIEVDQKRVFYQEHLTLIINKPIGYLSANHDPIHPVVFDLIKEPFNRFDLKIAGRLDLDSEGLMILSTDGALVHRLTSPHHHVDKVYLVTLDRALSQDDEDQLKKGFELKDPNQEKYFALAKAIINEQTKVTITIDQGRFHQVKKMFSHLNYTVLNLKRIKYGKITLAIEEATYREVQPSEII